MTFGFEAIVDQCEFTFGSVEGSTPFENTVVVTYSFEPGRTTTMTYDVVGIDEFVGDAVLFGLHWVEPHGESIMEATENRGIPLEEREELRDELVSAGEILMLRDIVPYSNVQRVTVSDSLMGVIGGGDPGHTVGDSRLQQTGSGESTSIDPDDKTDTTGGVR